MSKDLIRYDLLVQNALKGVVRKVLADTARDGLPPEHHFYISFRTDAPGTRVSNRLREKYPEEMTIVLQHQFWDLGVNEHTFEVGLSFSGVPERLLVPFDAITGFFDPSVQFGLKFDTKDEGGGMVTVEQPSATPRSEPAIKAPRGRTPDPSEMLPLATNGDDENGAKPPAEPLPGSGAPEGGADVVSLDAFRKKH
ncbi:SspB family protein [Chelatococcus reniformis]|uniref:Stringent starvation protein B n=1 Tax=Chelatococcus reniformis TaxID=1494448 RepID=A0A916XN13_9HYPH|nr:SspB family protein [Chelatococcus reniformis]GGC84118.1 hypothetical protein GCM10010994_47530 [Chelatococcus reniformis]